MTPLEARQRRVVRLTWLLLDAHADRAAAATARVLSSRFDLARIDPARLDRLCVLASRHAAGRDSSRRTARPAPSDAAAGVRPAAERLAPLHAASALPRQCLEAWVLTRVEGLDEVHVARAMDCSKTAAARHLARADELLAGTPAANPDSIRALVAQLDALDPGPALRVVTARLRRRRRIRLAMAALGAAVVAGGLYLVWRSGVLPF